MNSSRSPDLEYLAQQLQSEKISALKDMAGGVAHEINNPLAIILGKCNQLQRLLQQNTTESLSTAFQHVLKIEQTVARISTIVQGLEAFGNGLDSSTYAITSSEQILVAVERLRTEKMRQAGIQFLCRSPQNYEIECRPEQIIQCLLNLVDNSQDAIKSTANPWIGVTVEMKNSRVLFKVTDSGKGIHDQKILDRLMEPFFTTKEIGQGTGLGLSVAKGLIDAHGGKLWLNKESCNTEFVFELPPRQHYLG